MSFSGMVKEELSRQISTARHCRIAEIAALLSACGKMTAAGILRFQTENDAVVRKYFTLLQKTFNIETEIAIRESRQMKKGNVYYVEITDPGQVETVLQGTKLSVNEGDGETLYTENALLTQQSCCKRAFIRGAFLASGSISDPEKGYHFEIVTVSEKRAQQLQQIIRTCGIDVKTVVRKKYHVVYAKEGEQIGDLLSLMEAPKARMNFENIRILKDVRNSVNRKVNCEAANLNKTANASLEQVRDIEYISEYYGLESLPENLRQAARLRLEKPDASLTELGKMMDPPVSKSGVNHRFKKLKALADQMREKGGRL